MKSVNIKIIYRMYGTDRKSVNCIIKNGVGTIVLNRPNALNALNLDMIDLIYPTLKKWECDSNVSMIYIKGEGDKAFCAGGDVKVITEAAKQKNYTPGDDFFRSEYKLNYKIGTYKKPYMAFINGITMGGGVGLSVHGRYRIATEKTDFAMPETAIGLFPDVGGSYFLPKLPHNLGLFLGLTGQRLKGFEVLKAGIATHFIPSKEVSTFEEDLHSIPIKSVTAIDALLKKYHKQDSSSPQDFLTKDRLDSINHLFATRGEDTFNDFMIRLNEALKHSSDGAFAKLPSVLNRMSPTSLKVTFGLLQLSRAQNWDLSNAIKHEYRIACRFLRHSDFAEGVRAALVDKDRKPKWCPASLDEVSDSMVQQMLLPFGSHEGQELSLE